MVQLLDRVEQSVDSPAEKQTVGLLRASPLDEPMPTMRWVEHQLSSSGALGLFRKFHHNCREADEFYLSEYYVPVVENGTEIRLTTFHSTIETAVAHSNPRFLDVEVPPPGPRGQARAELLERAHEGIHHMIEERTPIRRQALKHEALYGVAWVKVEFDGTQWAEFPEPPEDGEDDSLYKEQLAEALSKRDIQWPIVAQVINPQELVWDTYSRSPRWVIRFTKASAADIAARFPDWSGSPKGEVDLWEMWTTTWVGYIADHRWAMRPRKHGYMTLPWVQFRPELGLETVGGRPEHLYRGIGHGNFDLFRAQSRLASQYLDIVGRSAWPTSEFVGPRGITESVMAEYSDAPGAKNYLPPGVERHASDVVEAPQTIIQAKALLDGAIETDTVPAIVRGERPRGVASGYESAVLASIGAMRFGPIVEGAEHGFQQVNAIVLHIIENVIRDRVTIYGRTEAGKFDLSIGPRDIRGHYVSMVKLPTVSPEEAERKLKLWRDNWSAGWVDHRTSLRNAGVSNPLEVIAQVAAERFEKHPLVADAFAALAAKNVPGLAQALEAVQAPTGSSRQATDIAQGIANQLLQPANRGSFSNVNQPDRTLASEAERVRTNSTPVLPGSLRESDLIARQLSGPRSGNQRVPTSDLRPGLGR